MDEERVLREVRRGENAAEVLFWERYWKAARLNGVRSGNEVWHERAVWRFIQFVLSRRLAEVGVRDVTDWLTLVASQPSSEGWRVQQASRALRILYQRVVLREWATPWPAGFVGENLQGTWLESGGGSGGVPVRVGEDGEAALRVRAAVDGMCPAASAGRGF